MVVGMRIKKGANNVVRKVMDWLLPVVLVVSLLVIMGNLKRTEQLTPEEAEKIGELTRGVEQKRVVRSTE